MAQPSPLFTSLPAITSNTFLPLISSGSCPRLPLHFSLPQAGYIPSRNLYCRVVLHVHAAAAKRETALVFSDESRGILCYRTESGEITCEGFDEGPYFRPPLQEEQRRIHCNGLRQSCWDVQQDFQPIACKGYAIWAKQGGVYEGLDEG